MNSRRRLWILLAAGIVCSILVFVWGLLRSPQNAFDDAFITYRYADNLRNGLGFLYNPGEWVLGTTAPLYAVLLGVLSRLGLPVEWWGHWISVFAWIVTAWAAMGQLWQRRRCAAGILAALVIAVHPLVVPALGMETALLLSVLLLASWAWMSDRTIIASMLSAAAILIRQDATLFVCLLVVAHSFRHRRAPWREVILMAILVLPWFSYAFWRYGSPLPNSALAKINQNQFMAVGGSKGFIEHLLEVLPAGSSLAAAAVGISLVVGLYTIARSAREWWWLPAWVVLYVGIYTAMGVVSYAWYFIPPATGVLLICSIGLGNLLGDCRSTVRSSRIAKVTRAAFALICVLVIGYTYSHATLVRSRTDAPGYLPEYRDVGAWLAANTLETDKVSLIEIGVIGHLSQRPILDTMGLVSPEMRGHLVGWIETLA